MGSLLTLLRQASKGLESAGTAGKNLAPTAAEQAAKQAAFAKAFTAKLAPFSIRPDLPVAGTTLEQAAKDGTKLSARQLMDAGLPPRDAATLSWWLWDQKVPTR
jgi:hypothetical protein